MYKQCLAIKISKKSAKNFAVYFVTILRAERAIITTICCLENTNCQ